MQLPSSTESFFVFYPRHQKSPNEKESLNQIFQISHVSNPKCKSTNSKINLEKETISTYLKKIETRQSSISKTTKSKTANK